MLFKGSGVAIVTPIKNDKIDYICLEKLIDFHLTNKTDAIIVCGTTGEAATMTYEEHKNVIEFTVEKVNKKIPVIAGSGSNDTKKAIELSITAEKVGADGLLIVSPFYNKCTQNGLINHYKAISNKLKIPIILYNIPSRTGVNILPKTVEILSKIDNIIGLKEASGDISQVAETFSLVDNSFSIYSGNDDQILPILSLGGKGVISVLANIYPNIIHEICANFFENNINLARDLQLKYMKIMKELFLEVNPICIKDAMNILGHDVGKVRLPLTNITEENHLKLIKTLDYYS